MDSGLLAEIIKKALKEGGDYADVFVEQRTSVSVRVEDRKVEQVVSGGEQGAGIRLIAGGKTAYAFSNELDEKTLLEIAGMLPLAISGARPPAILEAAGRVVELDLRRKTPSVGFRISLPPESVPFERKVKMVKSAESEARGLGHGIRQVTVGYSDLIQKVTIATSMGELAEDERVYTTAIVNVVAQEGGLIQTGYESIGGLIGFELFEETPLPEAAVKAGRRALMMLRAKKAPGGRMPVVISSEAGGTMIHEAIGHGLEADLARQGLSVFSGKLGKQVASKVVTVMDNATLPNKRGSFRFDDEGTASQRTVLVKDGILQGYLYDRLRAMEAGATSTGNGRRQSYQHRPIPRMTNTLIASGGAKPEEVIRATHRGLLVKKMGGGQVNTVTGDFVFDVLEGYLIENGSVGEPVRGATLTGNGPAVLMPIDMVASDLGFAIGTCGKDGQGVPVSDAMPTLRVPEMVVGGEV